MAMSADIASMQVINSEAAQMRKCLETPGRLMASLKHATLMLAELREELPPKEYYMLYSTCFDALSQLSTSLKEVHQSHHLADIYEHVQYASFAVPRLYLMVTVGAAFMAVDGAPTTDILQDMLDMCRGVQNPTRGLFLRYYLAQRVREFLPEIADPNDSVKFVMSNFIEMNKLWVRMQHLGPSTEKDKRAAERRDLQTIVGFNVERLAYLNLSLPYFAERVFPQLSQQIVHCRDPLAQEYLLDVICSAFPAEFHLGTLDAYLQTSSLLSPSVSLPSVLLLSIDRLLVYIRDERADWHAKEAKAEELETEPTKEAKPNAPEAADSEQPKAKSATEPTKTEEAEAKSELEANSEEKSEAKSETKPEPKAPAPKEPERSASPELLPIGIIFPTYWSHLQSLKDRLNHGQRARITQGLARLSYLLDPKDLGRVHDLLIFVEGESSIPDKHIVNLLLDLLDYVPLLSLISFGTFKRLLASQDRAGQQEIANKVLSVILLNGTAITEYEVAQQIFQLFGLITKSGNMDTLQLSELVYLLQCDDLDLGMRLLQLAYSSLRQGGVGVVQSTYGALVTAALRLLRIHRGTSHDLLLKFIGKTINDLATIGSQPEKAFRLYTFVAGIADELPAPEICYEFYVQAFTLYEEYFSDSRAQYQAICILTGSLQKSRNLGNDNYETLAQRCAQYGQKLLKKADQCRAIYMAAHLYYVEEGDTVHYCNNAKVLETLQRALRVADACMDAALSVELFVEVLNRFLYFLEREAGDVTEKHVNGLIELIKTNLAQTEDTATSESPLKYFERTLEFIENEQSTTAAFAQLAL